MRSFIFLIFLSVNAIHLWSQDIGDIEIELSEAVSAWQNAATELDQAMVTLNDLQKKYDDMVRARDWMESNLESRRAKKESPKSIKKAKKVYVSGLKKEKQIANQLKKQQKIINKLTNDVEKYRQTISKLTFQKNSMLKDGERQSQKVYSGYFPRYKSFYHAKLEDNRMFNPPDFPCKKAFDGTDPVLNKHRIEYEEQLFFSHQPDLVPLIDGQPYLLCSSYFTLVEGGQYFLNLNIKIHSKNPRQSFGYLERGSRLIITFLDGEELTLQNNVLHLGVINRKKGTVLYRGQYSLNIYAQNKIKKQPIDKVRIEWSKGYDDYDIFYVDLLQNQLKCL
ncbi:MAG TPA: hypothetical protein ENK85_04375 [Saprospiraceae bacterium]|nr:hypothetical protein [Saprospiraceae bacterium]